MNNDLIFQANLAILQLLVNLCLLSYHPFSHKICIGMKYQYEIAVQVHSFWVTSDIWH